MRSHWRTSPWSGAAIGVVVAAVLTWLVREGVQALRFATTRVDEGALASAFWLLLAVGVILAVVVFAAQLHPLIAGVPAAWFLVVFGPVLLGVLGTPNWYPEWMRSYFLQVGGEAAFVVTGVLVAATITAFFRRRLFSSEPANVDVGEARL